MSNRVEKLAELMDARGVDAAAFVPSANLVYLTGVQMHMSERVTLALFTREGAAHLIVPALEVPRVESRATIPLILHPWSDAEGIGVAWASLKRALNLEGKKVALDYYAVRVLELTGLEAIAPEMQRSDAAALLSEMRITKDATEIAAMRKASVLLGASLQALLPEVKPGMTEKELAARWQMLMHEHGSDTIPDEPIVCSGPNSAQPHTTATSRAVAHGDFIIFDGWCTVNGYNGDITRTVALGEPPAQMRDLYNAVLGANEAGRRASAPGVPCQDVDRAARRVITDAGLGQYFLHRTGHGLGLEVHEAPYMVEGYTMKLAPGMTFTVEPGCYIAGQGGVRIEDDVVVTQDGAETLTTMPRDLVVL